MHNRPETQAAPEAASSSRYVSLLVLIATLAVIVSAFDGIARNVALPAMLQSLHMGIAQGAFVFSAAFIVTVVGTLVIGPLMDRVGRKRVFVAALLAAGLFTGLTAFVTNAAEYVVLGVLAGTVGLVNGPAQVLVSEEVPAKWRGTLMGIVQAGFGGGALIVSLVGAALLPRVGWRPLFLLGFAPLLLAVWAAMAVREPVRSLEVMRVKRARDLVARGGSVETAYRVNERAAIRAEWRQLFDADLRRQTIVMAIAGFLVNFTPGFILVLGVAYITAHDHLGIQYAALALAVDSFANLVGTPVAGFMGDRIGARKVLVIWWILGGLSVVLLGLVHGFPGIAVAMGGYGFFGQAALGCWVRYVTDSFPTRARGSGYNFVFAIYNIGGGILAPAIYGTLMGAHHYVAVAAVAGGVSIVGALVLLAGREIPPRAELEEIAS